jgi:hypothetical protein
MPPFVADPACSGFRLIDWKLAGQSGFTDNRVVVAVPFVDDNVPMGEIAVKNSAGVEMQDADHNAGN